MKGLLFGILSILSLWILILSAPAFTGARQNSVYPLGFGFFEYNVQTLSDVSDEYREEIKLGIHRNIEHLKIIGKYQEPYALPGSVLLSWPLNASPALKDYGYDHISNFVDHDSRYPNYLLDFNCGNRTYDRSDGYNHKGTDFSLYPFGWKKMDNNEVEVIAAAAGTIVYKEDGNYDRNCSWDSTARWNAIYVQQSDGSIAWYGHLKRNSLTSKNVGDTVGNGEYLGIVGSSGNSTGPHLHFEVYDSFGNLVDPFSGPCNNEISWWESQIPYYDSAINKVATHSALPTTTDCSNYVINEKNIFVPGDIIYFVTYYRDELPTLPSSYTIYEPDEAVFYTWTRTPDKYYSSSYWYTYFQLPFDAKEGKWTFQVIFNEKTYIHTFYVQNCAYTISPQSHSFASSGGNGSISVSGSLDNCSWTATSNESWITITLGSSGTGSGTVTFSVPANITGSGRKGTITIAGKTFTVRQGKADFEDVIDPNYWAYNYVYAIYTEGITVGCSQNPPLYCPTIDVTRGQMAAFIIRSLYGENFSYTSIPYFSDVPSDHGFFKYVQKMKDEGITAVSGVYGVDDHVTRGQMAAFIIRSLYGENFSYTHMPYFSDVPSNQGFFKYVQKMKDEGITAVSGTYNVEGIVTREQMAAFLARAFLGME